MFWGGVKKTREPGGNLWGEHAKHITQNSGVSGVPQDSFYLKDDKEACW